MRIISLNTWGGRAGKEKLLDFFKTHAEKTDVFCLQEIWSAPYEHLQGHPAGGLEINHEDIMVYGLQDITATLSNHAAFFRPHHLENYGLTMFVRKDLPVIEEGELFVYQYKGYISDSGDIGDHGRNIQYATIQSLQGPLTVINFHGLWKPGIGKEDTPERLEQSAKILGFIKTIKNPFVLCGDFNLLPEAQSLRKFEEGGLRNLIREFGVTSTRTSYYTKPNKIVDYAFVSEGMRVKDFKVLPDVVSDHSPLLIEIE